jgi:hypothetical protein
MNPPKENAETSSDYMSYSQQENIIEARKPRGISKFIGDARAYLVEYALALVATGTLLSVTISMLSTILKYNEDDLGLFSSFAYTVSISMIATLIVVIPLVLLLTKRTNNVEDADPTIKNGGWRKGFLGFFLLNVGLWAIGFSIAFIYDFVSYFASFGISDVNTFPWRSLLANGVAAILLAFTVWLYSQDYRKQELNKPYIGKIHHYGLIALAILLTFIYLGTAFKSQRGTFIDDAISGDLSSIQSNINEYQANNNGRLPNNLSDLKLNDQQTARSDKYDYSYTKNSTGYELCAEFKTDTKSKKDKGSQNPLEAFSGSSYSYNSSSSSDSSNPAIHDKGKQCFKTNDRSSSYDPYNSSSQDSNSSQQFQDDTLTN